MTNACDLERSLQAMRFSLALSARRGVGQRKRRSLRPPSTGNYATRPPRGRPTGDCPANDFRSLLWMWSAQYAQPHTNPADRNGQGLLGAHRTTDERRDCAIGPTLGRGAITGASVSGRRTSQGLEAPLSPRSHPISPARWGDTMEQAPIRQDESRTNEGRVPSP